MESILKPPPIDRYLATPSVPEIELARLFSRTSRLTIFDIGSCEGEDSIRYARRFPRARIFAFEALPANQALIRENFLRYRVGDRAELVPLALSDRVGTAVFHISSGRPPEEFVGNDWNYGNKSSSLLAPAMPDQPMFGWLEFKESIIVPTDNVDRFCALRQITRIDFIHLDVQGAEYLVLAGAEKMLPRTTALWLEVSDERLYSGQKLRFEMEVFLRGAGFVLVRQERREIEGDQFYVNGHQCGTWPYLVRHRLARLLGVARYSLGTLKSKAIKHFAP
ncbi:MAG: FkbM family methyltransferase [Bryobacteraceae bacterium]|jgi:FkbM family methyltransferase